MVERGIVERVQHRGGRAHDEAVEQHRRAAQPGGEDRARDRGDLAPAEARQNLQRIAEMLLMARDRGAHRVGLALQARVVDAGAAADPVLRLAAVERVIDRRRRRRVADAHLAEHEQVRLGGERLHAEGHRRRAGLLVERRLLG